MIRADVRRELARFALVGGAGFGVDATALTIALRAGLGLLAGRLLSYICAASFTWIGNRNFTFASAAPPSVREWLRFLAANAVGGSANLAVYSGLVLVVPTVARHPVIGVAAGSICGLAINFSLSRALVFVRN